MRRPILLLTSAMFVACGGGEVAAPKFSIAAITAVSPVSAGASVSDSVRVRVTDGSGNPKAGIAVSFAITAGGGSISPATAVTDAQGRAAARFVTDTKIGVNTATATIAG